MMRGASFLRQPLPATVESAANALRAAKTVEELQSVWWRDCESFTGEPRETLQAIYALQLRKTGALHG